MRHAWLKLLVAASLLVPPCVALAVDPYEPDSVFDVYPSHALLRHGTLQSRDLDGVGDVDYIYIDPVPGLSYEVRVSTAGHFTAELTRRSSVNAALQTGQNFSYNAQRSPSGAFNQWFNHGSSGMNWIEPVEFSPNRTRFVRVSSLGATLTAANSQYLIQMRETTLYCPRYNNSGNQSTILIIQRAAPPDNAESLNGCDWKVNFYGQDSASMGHTLHGTASGSDITNNALYPNGMVVLPTAGVPGVGGTRGSIQIAHSCGYGNIQAKAVALEPATGFSFDTLCANRTE